MGVGVIFLSLFYFFGGDGTGRAGLGGGYIPHRWRPQLSAHPDGLHSTGTHALTLDTLHRSALDTRQAAPGRSYRRRDAGGRAACPKPSKIGQPKTKKINTQKSVNTY
nr:MAG TPA: hypothetical protein [Caudoviricetes sp.]